MTLYYYLGDETGSNALTTEGGDPLLLYSVGELLYTLSVDWDGDGAYNGDNEADYLLKWSSSRGRERIINASGRGFQPYEIGRLTMTLDNSSGRYDPWNSDSPLYGNLMPGRDMEFKVTYSSTDATGVTTYPVFTGTITDIQVNGYKETVNIVCEDGWRFLADWHYMRFALSTANYNTMGELLIMLRNTWAFDSDTFIYSYARTDNYPWGAYTVDYDAIPSSDFSSTDLPRHWWWDGSAKSAVEMITFGSLGRSWIRKDGLFDYDYLHDTTDASVLSLDEDNILKNVYLPTPWENLRSEIVLKGSNNFWYANRSVAKINNPIKINAGQTVDFSLRVSSGDIDIQGDYCTRVTGISCTANTAASSTGSDITSDITYTVDPFVKTFEVEATNGGASNGYITAFTVTGELLDTVDTEWRYESTGVYRDASFVLDNLWLSVTAVGSTGGYFEETATTLDDRARVNTIGETLKSYLSTVKAYPVIQLQGRWKEQFLPELEDKIALTIGTLGIDDDYRINKIKHQSLKNTQDILTTFWLYPIMTPVEST